MLCTLTALTFSFHLATWHSRRLQPGFVYNNENPGISVQTDEGCTAGVYYNSYFKTSTYLGKTWTTEDKRYSVMVGGVTGYPIAKVAPVIAPAVMVSNLKFVLLIPTEKNSGGVHLMFQLPSL